MGGPVLNLKDNSHLRSSAVSSERSVEGILESERATYKDNGKVLPGHKIRNPEDKIASLGTESQLVKAVYQKFCVPKIVALGRNQTELWDQLKVGEIADNRFNPITTPSSKLFRFGKIDLFDDKMLHSLAPLIKKNIFSSTS